MILLHGRGSNAEQILTLANEFNAADLAYLAPQAAGNSWYPYPFLAPVEQNRAYLSSALALIDRLFTELADAGIPPQQVAVLGFSQGACLALEYVARHPRIYGAIVAFSGGIIGPPGMLRQDLGDLGGSPVFIGCSDIDPHIPLTRVHESTTLMRKLGGDVTERIYPSMGHIINADELMVVRTQLAAIRTRGV